jgi:nitroreductase
MSHRSLLDGLQWRYATKHFDAQKTIPSDIWKQLEESLILTPSSYGLQPWKFVVITNPELKTKLLPHTWGQKQVVDCSHFVVFASKTTIDHEYIDENFKRTEEVRGVPAEKMKGYRDMIVKNLVHDARAGDIEEWASRQCYIALGQFMLACSLLHIDACPMEGFVPAEYDKILNLTTRGLTAAVCCAAGYRAETDKYATAAKVRFPAEKLVEHL